MRSVLQDAQQIEALSAVVADKGGGHLAHQVDLSAEGILFALLDDVGYEGVVFSEERGLVELGNQARLLVCDPYCNTSLTFRGFRESAVAAYEYGPDGEFVSGAIADLQVRRILFARAGEPACVVHPPRLEVRTRASVSDVRGVEDALLTISLLKRKRRAVPPLRLFADAAMVTTVDGAITAARLGFGEIDGFVDGAVGQPSYEALAYQLVERAGGTVTDHLGKPLDFGRIARGLGRGVVDRHPVVAASTEDLHREIMARLTV
ncbi:hypothetical protein [Streptomyces prasinosporus]